MSSDGVSTTDPSTSGRPRQGLLPVEEIRARFPALERRYRGRRVAYFDAPGGTQMPEEVADAVAGYLARHNANRRWRFPTSRETDAVVASARRAVAELLGGAADEVAFGANMTTLTLHLSRALGRRMGPGDEIVVTELDHHANVDPWRALAAEAGVTVRTVRMHPATGTLDPADLEAKVGPATRLVALGLASNALGTVNDVRRAVRLARDAGALVFVDAVHAAPHLGIDVEALGCDFLACSLYKLYGPHLGALWGRRERLEELDPPRVAPAPDAVPERMETGTLNHEGLAGTAAAVDFLVSLAADPPAAASRRERLRLVLDAVHARGRTQTRRLWRGLADVPGVRLHGPPPDHPRTPTVAFTVEDRPAGDVAAALADRALFLSHGAFYATTAVERLGLADRGLVRAGCACYTTDGEIDRLVEAVAEVAA